MPVADANAVNENLYTLVAPVSSTTAGGTLANFTLPANALRRNGQSLRVTAWGVYAANSNNKIHSIQFGPTGSLTSIIASGTLTDSGTSWEMQAIITRSGSATENFCGGGSHGTTLLANANAAGTVDLTKVNQVQLVYTASTAAADIVLQGFIIEGLSD